MKGSKYSFDEASDFAKGQVTSDHTWPSGNFRFMVWFAL